MVGATGGAEPWTGNLAPGVSPKEVEAAYGSDPAWRDDLALPHSSAALTVNLFAPWQADLDGLSIAGVSGFTRFQFEVDAPLGLEGAPAYFDAFGTSGRRFVAIEVKCLEYLSQPSEKYRLGFEQSIRQICETNGSSEAGWLGEANRLNRDLKTYSALFAHQLVKQAFALRHQHGRDRHLLFYLFWEPVDWGGHPFFVRHRRELDRLSRAVAGEGIEFRFQSVNDLLDDWINSSGPSWLPDHVQYLKQRYRLEIGAS